MATSLKRTKSATEDIRKFRNTKQYKTRIFQSSGNLLGQMHNEKDIVGMNSTEMSRTLIPNNNLINTQRTQTASDMAVINNNTIYDMKTKNQQSKQSSRHLSRQFKDQNLQNKHFWNDSLQTRPLSNSLLSRSCEKRLKANITEKLENSNLKKGFLPTINTNNQLTICEYHARYPRGQQRPSSLASSHKQLLDRHQQIMMTLTKRKIELKYQQRILTSCSQRNHKIMMLSRNSEKCQDWMNKWNLD